MATGNFTKFLTLVSTDTDLQTRLNKTSGAGEFTATAIALGIERGLEFTEAEVRTTMDELAAQSSEKSSELSEAELNTVAGGICVGTTPTQSSSCIVGVQTNNCVQLSGGGAGCGWNIKLPGY
jgi:hypothetical protein